MTATGNVTGGNLVTAGLASVTGNVIGGNVTTTGLISATGNITGNYILGNGSQLTGLPATYGNTNVSSFLAAFSSNTISTTGTVTTGNLTAQGYTQASNGSTNIISSKQNFIENAKRFKGENKIKVFDLYNIKGKSNALNELVKYTNNEYIALLGENGAGKSTTFELLTCQMYPT